LRAFNGDDRGPLTSVTGVNPLFTIIQNGDHSSPLNWQKQDPD